VAEHVVCRVGDLSPRRGRQVVVGDRELAVFLVDGEVRVYDGLCPHLQGPLGEGYIEDGCLECPWHAWRFDLRTGAGLVNPNLRLQPFPSRIDNGDVVVDL
jgi:nitrite reductase (NADH) small subunit